MSNEIHEGQQQPDVELNNSVQGILGLRETINLPDPRMLYPRLNVTRNEEGSLRLQVLRDDTPFNHAEVGTDFPRRVGVEDYFAPEAVWGIVANATQEAERVLRDQADGRMRIANHPAPLEAMEGIEPDWEEPAVIPPARRIPLDTVLMSVTLTRLGTHRKVDSDQVESDADGNAITVSKIILAGPEMSAIGALDRSLRKKILEIALPLPLRTGYYSVPLAMVPQVEQLVQAHSTQRERLIAQLVENYDTRIEEARQRLGTLFLAADYPTADLLPTHFTATVRYLELNLPTRLSVISHDLYQAEEQRFHADLEGYLSNLRDTMEQTFTNLLQRFCEVLLPNEEGVFPRLYASALEGVQAYVSNFVHRNIAGDEELAARVANVREVLDGCTIEELRRHSEIRVLIAQQLRDIVPGNIAPLAPVEEPA